MKGLEEAKLFFNQQGLPFFKEKFPEVLPHLAVGMAGRGSECFGFDDDFSRDHDYRIGFTLWLKKEDESKYGFKLQRLYDELIRANTAFQSKESKLGPSEHGVVSIEDFYRRHIGIPGAPRTWQEWLYTPEYAFAEAVNGSVFMDEAGTFSRIRSVILYDMPEDVRLKKIAARLVAMAQSGQYNFERCHKHGEPGAAAVALGEFVKNAVSLIFLLNFRFAPYYKWQFRAMKELPELSELAPCLEELLTKETSPQEKCAQVEHICSVCLDFLRNSGLTGRSESYLEPHAFEVMKQIRSHVLRQLHVMEG